MRFSSCSGPQSLNFPTFSHIWLNNTKRGTGSKTTSYLKSMSSFLLPDCSYLIPYLLSHPKIREHALKDPAINFRKLGPHRSPLLQQGVCVHFSKPKMEIDTWTEKAYSKGQSLKKKAALFSQLLQCHPCWVSPLKLIIAVSTSQPLKHLGKPESSSGNKQFHEQQNWSHLDSSRFLSRS